MLKPSLQLRLGQQLTMTPQLQQAIRLLQLPALELQQQVREALEQNVMLEAEDENDEVDSLEGLAAGGAIFEADAGVPDPSGKPLDTERLADGGADADVDAEARDGAPDDWESNSAPAAETSSWNGDDDRALELSDRSGESLQEHLLWQLELGRLSARELTISRLIVDSINDDGYLSDSLEELRAALGPEFAATEAELEAALSHVQACDPAGVGARNVRECILLQLAQLSEDVPCRSLAMEVARNHLELVASQQYGPLRRILRASEEELTMALALVRSCHPRPGSTIQPSEPDYIVPDVYVRRGTDGWVVDLNASALPKVRLNQTYAGLVTRASDHAVLRTQLQEARWLLRSLEIRNETLLKVARCIVARQTSFLNEGEEAMEPMVLRDVAEAVELHESTISRVTTGKYMHTPRGVIEFRYFFSSHVAGNDGSEMSSTAIRAKIRKLIAAENPEAPLSDSRLAEVLSTEGVKVARRTVAKYRESMNIAPSSERRRPPPRN